MANDEQMLQEIWKGRVPVSLSLHRHDCDKLTLPLPYHMMMPRISYFPLFAEQIFKYFSSFIAKNLQKEDMWLEYDGIALKWNLCIGVLYDLYAAGVDIPWSLTVHYSEYPETKIQRFGGVSALESQFLTNLKEADAFKHKGLIMSNFQKQDHLQLWNGLSNDRFDQFWAINKKLMKPHTQDGFLHIPFRLYIDKKLPVQKLQKPFLPDGTVVTLGMFLESYFPEKKYEELRVLIHGISPSENCPLQWLSETFSYPDNFLHICVEM